ncbi:MAG: thioredoxin family protein [Opitutales bacterium]
MKPLSIYLTILSLSTVLLHAEESVKPLKLLYFTASWCGPCQLMKQETWPNTLVKKSLEAYTFESVDVDAQKELAEKWAVRSMPTYLITDPDGKIELVRMSGFMDAYRMSSWLDETDSLARQSLQSLLETRRLAEQNWKKMAPLTQNNLSEETLKPAREALYTLLKQRGKLPDERSNALDMQLHLIADTNPHYIAEGILHKDLQVRAHIARALSAQGERLDPWANQDDRKKAYNSYLAPKNL